MPFMPSLRLTLLTASLLASMLANAQSTTYQWIDPKTGTTVISDQQPPPGARQIVKKEVADRAEERQIPYATRQAAENFPVRLYATANCGEPCTQARNLLNARGIPFSEKILQTQEDLAELSKLLGSEAAAPSVSIGRQNFKGFEAGAWNNLLDLAGYPKTAPYGSKAAGVSTK